MPRFARTLAYAGLVLTAALLLRAERTNLSNPSLRHRGLDEEGTSEFDLDATLASRSRVLRKPIKTAPENTFRRKLQLAASYGQLP